MSLCGQLLFEIPQQMAVVIYYYVQAVLSWNQSFPFIALISGWTNFKKQPNNRRKIHRFMAGNARRYIALNGPRYTHQIKLYTQQINFIHP